MAHGPLRNFLPSFQPFVRLVDGAVASAGGRSRALAVLIGGAPGGGRPCSSAGRPAGRTAVDRDAASRRDRVAPARRPMARARSRPVRSMDERPGPRRNPRWFRTWTTEVLTPEPELLRHTDVRCFFGARPTASFEPPGPGSGDRPARFPGSVPPAPGRTASPDPASPAPRS